MHILDKKIKRTLYFLLRDLPLHFVMKHKVQLGYFIVAAVLNVISDNLHFKSLLS